MSEPGKPETGKNSDEILADIIESLQEEEVTDTHLLGIITQGTWSPSRPAEDAAAAALKDIVNLAKRRAEQNEGTNRHD